MFDAKYCEIDGMKIQKGGDVERFGKHFCSEAHAQQYTEQMQKARQEQLAAAPQGQKQGGRC